MTTPEARSAETKALDALRDAIVLVDEDWEVLYLNPAAKAFFATSASAPPGLSLWRLLPDELAARLRAVDTMPASLVFQRRLHSDWWLIEVLPAHSGRVLQFRHISPHMHLVLLGHKKNNLM